jgi:hypothetical protein
LNSRYTKDDESILYIPLHFIFFVPKRKTGRVLIAIREDLVEEINQIAIKSGKTYRDIIEWVLEQFLKTYKVTNKLDNYYLYFIIPHIFFNIGFSLFHPAFSTSTQTDGNLINIGKILGKHFSSLGILNKELIEIMLKFLLQPNPNVSVEEKGDEIIIRLNAIVVTNYNNMNVAKLILNGIMEVNGYKLISENLESINNQYFTGELRFKK